MDICCETIQIFYTVTEDNTCCVPCQNSNGNILFLYGGNFPQTALASDRWVDGARHTPIIFVNLSPFQVGQIYHYGFDGLS